MAVIVWCWVLLGAATAWWCLRLWRRRKELSPRTRILVAIVAPLAMAGAFGTGIGLVKAFGAVGGESVDPSQKARILAENISGAMNSAAFGIFVWFPSVVTLVVLARKRDERSE